MLGTCSSMDNALFGEARSGLSFDAVAGCTSIGLFSLPSNCVYLVLTPELQACIGKSSQA